jgi:hypothetical protein
MQARPHLFQFLGFRIQLRISFCQDAGSATPISVFRAWSKERTRELDDNLVKRSSLFAA